MDETLDNLLFMLWGLPIVGIALGLLFLYVKSKKWVKKEQESLQQESESPLTAEEQRILEADMKRFENS